MYKFSFLAYSFIASNSDMTLFMACIEIYYMITLMRFLFLRLDNASTEQLSIHFKYFLDNCLTSFTAPKMATDFA